MKAEGILERDGGRTYRMYMTGMICGCVGLSILTTLYELGVVYSLLLSCLYLSVYICRSNDAVAG